MIDEKAFWDGYEQKLHCVLATEMPHPKTVNLSQLAQDDLSQAVQIWRDVNTEALKQCLAFKAQAQQLHIAIQKTWVMGGRVIIAGCGASGRLAVLLEQLSPSNVVGMIAGGDVALIRSVESFEDSTELAVRQLQQYGFSDRDLLLGLSVNGEARFIQSLIQYAAEQSQHIPILISCNPAKQLLERNPQHVITHQNVQFIDLTIGSLALTGSTRLQTTDVMMWVLGQALLTDVSDYQNQTESLVALWQSYPLHNVEDVIKFEADCYAKGGCLIYQTNQAFGLTVLSDTTERAPTFNVTPFENYAVSKAQNNDFSNCYLAIKGQQDIKILWKNLLGREPVCLNWPDFKQTSPDYFYGFDISEKVIAKRQAYLPKQQVLNINDWLSEPLSKGTLVDQLLLKMRLNMHSTLVMGRLGYYQGNLMTSLYPGNIKLVDRAVRYVQYIAKHRFQQDIPYRQVANTVLDLIPNLQAQESLVEKALIVLKPY